MCDFFWQRDEATTDQGGDLADIVRATGVIPCPSSNIPSSTVVDSFDQFKNEQPAAVFPPLQVANDFNNGASLFGNLHNPLLHESSFFKGSSGENNNLFSRVLQISPNKASQHSPGSVRPPVIDHGVHIPFPRTSSIKRRKSQAKKVVCIPAPAAASSKPSGEVVPSDLWAWRKYGQKPIKGSPYPRGYYRCSSSKGCSARKQVERSRTDPNMLVITYTSEHNHPWPTQRNALAGSTRSNPVKNIPLVPKEEPKEMMTLVKEEPKSMTDTENETFRSVFYSDNMTNEPNYFADLDFSETGFVDQKADGDGKSAVDSFIEMFDWGGSSFGDLEKKGL